MSRNTEAAVARILEFEGGIAQLPGESFVTRFGQTPQWLDANGFVPPSSVADAAVNYEQWMEKTRIAQICELSPTIGFLLADWATHSGESVAIKALQKVMGVTADGAIGAITLKAVQEFVAKDAGSGRFARAYWRARLRFIGELLGSQKVDRRSWANGWIRRLAAIDETLP